MGSAACATPHLRGSPCPAEAREMNGGKNSPEAYCELYEERVRYALRLIADATEDALCGDKWKANTETVIDIASL